jgi:hypothetical protein
LVNGYNAIFISNGLKRLSYFLVDKVLEFSRPISQLPEIVGSKTSLGKKVNNDLLLLKDCVNQIGRDGLILVEENISPENEIEVARN